MSIQTNNPTPRSRESDAGRWSFVSESDMDTNGVLRVFKGRSLDIEDECILIEKLDNYRRILWFSLVLTMEEYRLISDYLK